MVSCLENMSLLNQILMIYISKTRQLQGIFRNSCKQFYVPVRILLEVVIKMAKHFQSSINHRFKCRCIPRLISITVNQHEHIIKFFQKIIARILKALRKPIKFVF